MELSIVRRPLNGGPKRNTQCILGYYLHIASIYFYFK